MSLTRRSLKQCATHIRLLTTESVQSSNHQSPLPPPPSSSSTTAATSNGTATTTSTRTTRSRLGPTPRPTNSHFARTQDNLRLTTRLRSLPSLPHNFGANQLLAVPTTTRDMLESIVAQFEAPIRYAFAYGSGVFEQDGYKRDDPNRPMLDFMFAVSHPSHWHSINMARNPSHYPLHARLLGSDFVAKTQEVGPGVWFNPYVTVKDVTIKYGVTSIDTLCSDLLSWHSLYLAGRMHKPLRIIKDDARVRLTQQVNLTSALRTALLTLPERFSERELFERIAGLSYSGDPRMWLPAENRNKLTNIVSKQVGQFRELYRRLALGLPGVQWNTIGGLIEQDLDPKTRVLHLRKLPSGLLTRVDRWYMLRMDNPSKEADDSAYWKAVAGDPRLSHVITQGKTHSLDPFLLLTPSLFPETKNIVGYPATLQSMKGLVSAGFSKSFRYGAGKVGKWWKSESK
ncbi:hypothetical protein Clacol_007707 [Clathrus columnatus]|uniref:Phosphatidate cytidylyltransferase, mitochondrial n=1 Tax=Clathrus columnatus TaxID=1419009 RepID=A0AAV5AL84_9AGAM|nr:hypothetical protein Clacol_007707 [Clathrus columnatus]